MEVTSARTVAVIPAAGSGTRLGGALPKQYLMLHGRPLLWHSATALTAHAGIDEVIVVIDGGDSHWDALGLTAALPRCRVLRAGGATRARTVLNGLRALGESARAHDWILVHDAARPCLDTAALDRLLHALRDDEVGGLLAIPVRDTLKRAGADGRVEATHPRAGLWQAQTPQMFRHGLLRRALEAADLDAVTDEAAAVEGLGLHPLLVEGSARNIKVTYADDVALAEAFLQP